MSSDSRRAQQAGDPPAPPASDEHAAAHRAGDGPEEPMPGAPADARDSGALSATSAIEGADRGSRGRETSRPGERRDDGQSEPPAAHEPEGMSPPPSESEGALARYTSARRVTLEQALCGDKRAKRHPRAPAPTPSRAPLPPEEERLGPAAPTIAVARAASARRAERGGGRRRPTLTQLRRERLGRYPALTDSLTAAMRRVQRARWRGTGLRPPAWSRAEEDSRDLAARRDALDERRGRRRLATVLLVGAACALLTLGVVGMLAPSAVSALVALLPHAPTPTATPVATHAAVIPTSALR